MKLLIILSVLVSGCSLFHDIEEITFRPSADAGLDVSVDLTETPDLDLDAKVDSSVPDIGVDLQTDLPVDVSIDVVEDMVSDVVVLTGCARDGCEPDQYCDEATNTCMTSGPCALEGCAQGLVCDYRGQCVPCATNSDCGTGAICSGFRCSCTTPQNFCSQPDVRPDACVDRTSIEACGENCETCPTPPEFSTAICGATGCDFECKEGYVKRDGACIQAGIYCDNPGGSIGGSCDPVGQTGCIPGTECIVRLVSANSYQRVCSPPSALPVALEGESCIAATGKTCEAGYSCLVGVCRRRCDTSNAAGCLPTQYCAPALAPTPGLGFCSENCSP